MTVAAAIRSKLTQALHPHILEINDDSDQHRGHAGARPGGQTHFRLKIVAAAFEGLSRIERQRLVNRILVEEFAGSLHALSLETRTPEEVDPST